MITFCCLDNADFQTLKCLAGQLLQRAQRRWGSGDPVSSGVGAGHFLQHPRWADTGDRLLHWRLVQDILDAERRQRLVGIGRRRQLIQGSSPPLVAAGLQHRTCLHVFTGGHRSPEETLPESWLFHSSGCLKASTTWFFLCVLVFWQ